MSSRIGMTSKKYEAALLMMRVRPMDWLRQGPIDVRDEQLINANAVSFVTHGSMSYVRKLYYRKAGDLKFYESNWTVENNQTCMDIVAQMGGNVAGFESGAANGAVGDLSYALVNVNITAPPNQGTGWGYLSTRAENVRIFRGPRDTCPDHPWDAMILRDCTANTDNLIAKEEISSRKWDILAMKMCEDYDAPWLVVAVRDSGAASDAYNPGLPDCQCSCGAHPSENPPCTVS
ncbi:aaa family atpase protein [Apiospora sp. TS-2023a]